MTPSKPRKFQRLYSQEQIITACMDAICDGPFKDSERRIQRIEKILREHLDKHELGIPSKSADSSMSESEIIPVQIQVAKALEEGVSEMESLRQLLICEDPVVRRAAQKVTALTLDSFLSEVSSQVCVLRGGLPNDRVKKGR